MQTRPNTQQGSILIFALSILSLMVAISIGIIPLFISRLRASQEAANSTIAVYAADSGIEWCLYSYNSGVSGSTNYALATNGSTATASSMHSSGLFNADRAINGIRKGTQAEGGDYFWNDNTLSVFPDWLQIDFNQTRVLNQIIIYTVQDNNSSPEEPTDSMTFTLYGIVNFYVEYWDGEMWTLVPGGNITGNNHIKTKIDFPFTISTNKIRVTVISGQDNAWSRITEVEAFNSAGAAQPIMENGATYQIYRDNNISTCQSTDGTINYRSIGTYKNINRSFEVSE